MGYSAVIVLGNLMTKTGELNHESTLRLDLAINAFHNNDVPFIVTCGWDYRADSSITIADAMKAYAINEGGVPVESILTEINSRDTVGDAVFSKKHIIKLRGWRKLLVATSDYHVVRSTEIFKFIYGDNYSIRTIGARTDASADQIQTEERSLTAFRETFDKIKSGDDVAIFNRLCKKHPYYNGEYHPKIQLK